jgi:ubiquinone biosynthesis protein
VALAQNDAEAALDAAMELGLLSVGLPRRAYALEIDKILSELTGVPIKEWSFAQALWRVARMGQGQHFALPRDLLVLFRALFLIESTIRALSPEFDLIGELTRRHAALEQAASPPGLTPGAALQTAREMPALVAQWLKQAQKDEGRPGIAVHVRGLEELEATLARTGNRLALALVTLGLYVAGSLLMLHSAGPRVLGDLPVSALVAYGLAFMLTWRLVKAIVQSGRF